MRRSLLVAPLVLFFSLVLASPLFADWRAGVAKVDITPQAPMWMSGYGGRDRPSEGKLTDLWAKVLVFEDPQGMRLAAVTLDLVGIDRETSLAVRKAIYQKHGLELPQVSLFTSHTHTGPVVGNNLAAMYFISDEQWQQVDRYTQRLQTEIVDAVGRAIADLEPCQLAWGTGQATFAVNRRENPEKEVPRLREEGKLKGPIDHDVPVLRVTAGERLKAVLFGYACHSTVLSFYQWSGDYPGFAQMALEKKHPEAMALFFAGCGADQNPLPRRTVELAQEYGGRLATAVDKVLEQKMTPVAGSLAATYEEIDLPQADLPSRAQLAESVQTGNRYEARRAKLLLEKYESDGKLDATYPYPVQTWRIGPELVLVTLGGEVVVDYSLRLKKELGAGNTWVAGYTNDVMAYIPSVRVLKEGGYEGASSMVIYGLPTVWAPPLEEMIVKEAKRQADGLRKQEQ